MNRFLSIVDIDFLLCVLSLQIRTGRNRRGDNRNFDFLSLENLSFGFRPIERFSLGSELVGYSNSERILTIRLEAVPS